MSSPPVDTGRSPIIITNGPEASADTQKLYSVDTPGKPIWRVASNDDASLDPPERHVVIEDAPGIPMSLFLAH